MTYLRLIMPGEFAHKICHQEVALQRILLELTG